jgi:hypothetical protein
MPIGCRALSRLEDATQYYVWVWFAQERGANEAMKGNETKTPILGAEALKGNNSTTDEFPEPEDLSSTFEAGQRSLCIGR